MLTNRWKCSWTVDPSSALRWHRQHQITLMSGIVKTCTISSSLTRAWYISSSSFLLPDRHAPLTGLSTSSSEKTLTPVIVPTLTLNFTRNEFFATSARPLLDAVLSETTGLERASRNPYKIRVFTPTCHNVGYHSNRDTIEPDSHKPITWWSCSHTNQRKPVVYNHFVVKTDIFYRAVIDFR